MIGIPLVGKDERRFHMPQSKRNKRSNMNSVRMANRIRPGTGRGHTLELAEELLRFER